MNMKIFKMLALAAVMVLSVVACSKEKTQGGGGTTGGFDGIENEWRLVSVGGVANDFTVYIKFEGGVFTMYQQVYSLDYVAYSGQYSIDGGVLSGSYFDGSDWKTSYKGGVSGTTLTLTSQEENAITSVYEVCTIPEEVKAEADGTRALDVVPFL